MAGRLDSTLLGIIALPVCAASLAQENCANGQIFSGGASIDSGANLSRKSTPVARFSLVVICARYRFTSGAEQIFMSHSKSAPLSIF